VAKRLQAKGREVRVGSRSAVPPFDWDNEKSWDACLKGVSAAYITYAPDLAMPGATDAIRAFVDKARQTGVKRLVLLSGRGEPEAQACETIVQESGLEWTIVRASWFYQNLSDGAFIVMVLAGTITLPAGDQVEPFVDVDDIADVAVAAFTEDHHQGQIYEVTGPRLMSMADVAADLSKALGREISYMDVSHDGFVADVANSGAPKDVVWLLDYLFATVLDGRTAHPTDGIQRAPGRPPQAFADYAKDLPATGVRSLAA